MPLVLIDAFGEGIDPPQAWKAPEVLVGGGEGRTVLDGQSGEDGIGSSGPVTPYFVTRSSRIAA